MIKIPTLFELTLWTAVDYLKDQMSLQDNDLDWYYSIPEIVRENIDTRLSPHDKRLRDLLRRSDNNRVVTHEELERAERETIFFIEDSYEYEDDYRQSKYYDSDDEQAEWPLEEDEEYEEYEDLYYLKFAISNIK
jgi:hypothetical protein